jgi:hypothetical protein
VLVNVDEHNASVFETHHRRSDTLCPAATVVTSFALAV